MPRIRCRYIGCMHLENGLCTASLVELDPEEGCATFTVLDDPFDDDWDEEDEDEFEGYEDWEDEEEDDFPYDIEDDY